MNSGIEISDEIVKAYKELALKRKLRYIIYKPNADCSAVEIQEAGDADKTWEDFKNALEPTSSRWLVYGLKWDTEEGRSMDKVCFIAYAPDNAADGGQKFVVAANKTALTNKMKGASTEATMAPCSETFSD